MAKKLKQVYKGWALKWRKPDGQFVGGKEWPQLYFVRMNCFRVDSGEELVRVKVTVEEQ